MYLAGQLYPECSLGPYKAYLDATQEAHGYLLLDLTENTKGGLRYRTHIFPDENHPLTVYSYVGEEAIEDEISHSAGAEGGRPEIA